MNIPDDMLLMHNGKFDQLPPSHHFANELLLGKAPCKQYFFPDIWNIIQNENPVLPLKDFCLWHFLLKSTWVLDADRFSSYLYPSFANIGGIAMNLYCCKYFNTVLSSHYNWLFCPLTYKTLEWCAGPEFTMRSDQQGRSCWRNNYPFYPQTRALF